jgi:ADP-heptose:LPS heptosyltransferase
MPPAALNFLEVESLPTGVLTQLSLGATVVVIRLRSLGDTVLTTPALALLRRARPDVRVIVVVETPFDTVLDGNPDISAVLPVSRKAGIADRFAILRSIRRNRPELCLNLHGGPTSAWLTALSGARHRAGFAHFRQRWAYNIHIPRPHEILGKAENAPVHTAEHLASAIFHLGAARAEIPGAVLAATPPVRRDPYAVFHVTASYFTKQWPVERFRRIAAHVQQEHGLEPIMIAGPGEGAVFEKLRGFTCLDNLDVRLLKSLMAGARLFVGNDSGPAHIAAAFGVPCVVIFGSSNSIHWRPWKTPHAVVETAWDCKPCPGDRCYAFDEPRCILSVEAEPVERAVDELLQSARETSSAPRGVIQT